MILAVDVGTTSLRAAVVDPAGQIVAIERRESPPASPAPGLVEFDATALADLVLDACRAVVDRAGHVRAVGITNQRASAIVWHRATGEPVGPGIGWQDLRTVGECIAATAEHGITVAPNQTASKVAWLLQNAAPGVDPAELCVGTVDSWVARALSGGALHVTDDTNAAVTGLFDPYRRAWDPRLASIFGVPLDALPDVVDSSGPVGEATALPGSPVIAALAGDQQASMVGQGCVRPGMTKITFGTGAMLDICTGADDPVALQRTTNGTFPIVAWTRGGTRVWGVESIMLAAGTNVDWLRDDLGLIATSAASHDVAQACEHTDGVVYVPALLGLGTPHWDYGARGTLLGLTRGSTRAHVVRAVLEGVAQRGADLVDATVTDTALTVETLRIDGGMSQNPTFTRALADATGRPVEVAPVVEATTLGAAHLAGIATGVWGGFDDTAAMWEPADVVEPGATDADRRRDRQRWRRAVSGATGWIPELSALDF
ncbi:MAG: FGGY family carbohydrate kinase [Ilumatobacteraceae bacterium]